MVPSTWPSIVRSSLPFNSPLMTTDFPIFTMSFSIGFLSVRGMGTPTVVGVPIPRTERNPMEKDIVNIGKSVVIKGELNGSEDLTIEGHVEGTIQLRDHVLTI